VGCSNVGADFAARSGLVARFSVASSTSSLAMWVYSHFEVCGDIPASASVGIYPPWRCVVPTLTARKLQDVAAVVKAAREDAGLSQSDLAERLAFSRDYMGDLESGVSNLYITRLFRVLHELRITVTLSYGTDRARS
jgi:HTH-type transcriptional regulator/antitoxin HipB